eukprot:12844905-Alexandrium_andersonii.AAC.1
MCHWKHDRSTAQSRCGDSVDEKVAVLRRCPCKLCGSALLLEPLHGEGALLARGDGARGAGEIERCP